MYLGDYHTHTLLSHGKGTVEDNIVAAVKKGLKEIAITDHGFGHGCYPVKRDSYDKAMDWLKNLRATYPQINIYLGLECNLISSGGALDLMENEADKLDIIVCGYHKTYKTDVKNAFDFSIPNMLGISTQKVVIKNTDAYIKLLENNKIDILSHLNYAIKADAVEVANACKHFGTYLELNGKRINMTVSELEKIAQNGVPMIVNSDAHRPEKVGDFTIPESVIEKVKIPRDLIANYDKIPVFRSRKK